MILILLMCGGVCLYFIVNKIIKYKNLKRLENLIKTDRYLNSNYQIQQINGKWALYVKNSDNKYVDLTTNSKHTLDLKDNRIYHYKDCIGTLSDVLSAFDYEVPVIIELKISKVY